MKRKLDLRCREPVHLKNRIDLKEWSADNFTNSLLSGNLSNVLLKFRVYIHPAAIDNVSDLHKTIRECECDVIIATVSHFMVWYNHHDIDKKRDCSDAFNDTTSCSYIDFFSSLPASNPFHHLPSRSSKRVLIYADYQHFADIFKDHTNDEVDNDSKFGRWEEDLILNYSDAIKSSNTGHDNNTLWLSTKMAHTPLHYDAYGCNVIVQLVGIKTWYLWKPNTYHPTTSNSSTSSSLSPSSSSLKTPATHGSSKNTNLPPCRIPYEESTVYSHYDPLSEIEIFSDQFINMDNHNEDNALVSSGSDNNTSIDQMNMSAIDNNHNGSLNLNRKKMKKHTSSLNPPDYIITMRPGNALFVPPHYWHFVITTSDLALSVNQWLPKPMVQAQVQVTSSIPRSVQQQDQQQGTEIAPASQSHPNNSIPITSDNDNVFSSTTTDVYDHLSESIVRFVVHSLTHSLSLTGLNTMKNGNSNSSSNSGSQNGWFSPTELAIFESTENKNDSGDSACSSIDNNNDDDDEDGKEDVMVDIFKQDITNIVQLYQQSVNTLKAHRTTNSILQPRTKNLHEISVRKDDITTSSSSTALSITPNFLNHYSNGGGSMKRKYSEDTEEGEYKKNGNISNCEYYNNNHTILTADDGKCADDDVDDGMCIQYTDDTTATANNTKNDNNNDIISLDAVTLFKSIVSEIVSPQHIADCIHAVFNSFTIKNDSLI